jgi:AcrR family transcriptional regulator
MKVQNRMVFLTEETRARILDVAMKLFLDKGFFDTQMKDVASATALSRTSLYRYFRDKNDLAMSLLERIFDRRRAEGSAWLERAKAASAYPSGLDALAAYLKEHWLSSANRDEFVFLAEFDAYFSGSRVPADFKANVGRAIHGDGDPVLEELIKEASADGSMRSGLDLHLIMATLLNGVRGLQQRLLLRGDVLVETRSEELALMPGTLVDIMIEGLRSHQGESDEARSR